MLTNTEKQQIEKFRQAFNKVEKLLNVKIPQWEKIIESYSENNEKKEKHTSFKRLLDSTKKLDSSVPSKFQHELILLQTNYAKLNEIREIRNTFTHEDTADKDFLCIPSNKTIELLENIGNRLEEPLKLRDYLQKFKNSEEKPTFFNDDQSIGEVLRVIEEKEYTYFPIVSQEDNRIRILTGHAIAIYLAKSENYSFENIETITIADVLEQEENPNKYIVRKQNDYLYELIRDLQDPDSPLIVLISSKDEPSGEDLEAILTPWDYTSIYEFLKK